MGESNKGSGEHGGRSGSGLPTLQKQCRIGRITDNRTSQEVGLRRSGRIRSMWV